MLIFLAQNNSGQIQIEEKGGSERQFAKTGLGKRERKKRCILMHQIGLTIVSMIEGFFRRKKNVCFEFSGKIRRVYIVNQEKWL